MSTTVEPYPVADTVTLVPCDASEPWQPLESWTEEIGCDALLLAYEPVDPLTYADGFNNMLRTDGSTYERAIEEWLEYYEQQGIEAMGYGAVVLRRRDGDNWRRGYTLTSAATGAACDHLLRLFAAVDARLTDDELLASRFRLVPGHRLDQSLLYHDDYALQEITITLQHSAGLTGTVDAGAVPAVFALDPSLPLATIAANVESRPADILPTFHRLYTLGLIERV